MTTEPTPILQRAYDDGYHAGYESKKEWASQLSQSSYDDGADKARRAAEQEIWPRVRSAFLWGLVIGQIPAAILWNFT